ncbi:glucosyl-3-phosphoglycerate synthase [Jatrophihabitans telluris]|uniref:Glucosyl-3-phosphoglycerate synthase n=1 Tax=Jatrophihabitans telluris TaxID=2038343 RepID=A0ABY4QXM1_9ACTN|nr:glucosyl-3-phosphoglycerate synthase [Jatrophihabitans telluris]UQX88078.1 glucosyl-3-phosphoglycerate synthase [Jatrophihabitans telluris]
MELAARRWFDSHTYLATDFTLPELLERKREQNLSISVVIPARNEEATVAEVVSRISDALVEPGLVDELVVIDSDSTDATAALAAKAGAQVYAAGAIETGLKSLPGKGEALWRSLFVTRGDIVAFIDADLTEWGAHFITGLLGPMLRDRKVSLVKGFYDRLFSSADGGHSPQGGRVTELVARPLINLHWPILSGVVQPLAGEWAMRRSLAETLPFPVGYGVEFATLTDTVWRHGLGAVAQVDLGQRGHSHQNVHDLGVMATEILATATRRLNRGRPPASVGYTHAWTDLYQYDRSVEGFWRARDVPIAERPPAITVQAYPFADSAPA